MVVESLLGCVVDQEALSERLTSVHSREAVRALTEMPIAPALAMIAVALVRRTTPLLSQTVSADDYNRIAAVRIEQGTWQLRRGALDVIQNLPPDGPPPDRPVHPILVAVAVSARVEELEGATLPVAEGTAERTLRAMVAGIASPLDPATLNTMLTWRENLLFATADGAAHRQQEQLDQLVLENLRRSSADTTVLEAGLDTPVARLGGQLSGGQQQLVALGRALLSPARFLILDEPSSAFHPQLRTALIAVLQREARARSVVMVTHDMDLARSCDRIIFVREGAVAGDGTWETLEQDNLAFRDWTETNVRAA
jgi:ABC-type thiamine transport system ATPase subunit